MLECAGVLVLGFLLDLLLGDPFYRAHPVRLIGSTVDFFEKRLRRSGMDGGIGGLCLALTVPAVSLSSYGALRWLFSLFHPLMAWGFDVFAFFSCISLKNLIQHIGPVKRALEDDDLNGARRAVAMVVGRDTGGLDQHGVARAAVETMAENLVDGFLSPVFWFIAGGLAAHLCGFSPLPCAVGFAIIFKTASTLDSMVGYRNARYLSFGRAGAKLDDWMNYLPARFSIPVMFAGAFLCGLRPFEGLKTAMRDRSKHDSPNAGQPESFAAGALGVRLGGPVMCQGSVKDKAWLGGENPDPGIADIRRTECLVSFSAWITVMAGTGVAVAAHFFKGVP